MYACGAGHIECVTELLCNGANINVKNKNGYSCLMVAANEGYVTIVKV